MMLRAVRVRNTELEGSADEVLQGETHNLSQFSVGARCFVTDVMMAPLLCHAPRYNSVTNVPWQLYCRDEPRMSRCSICLQQWCVILSLHVTSDISPGWD